MSKTVAQTSSGLKRLVGWQWSFHRKAFLGGILVSFIPAIAALALIGVAGWFITATAVAGAAAVAINIFTPSAVIRGLAIARTGGRYAERLITHDATFRFLTDLRCRIFSGEASRAGDGTVYRSSGLLGRLTADVAALDGVYLRLVVPTVVAIGIGAGLLLFTVILAPAVALGPLVALVGTALVAGHLVRQRRAKAGRRLETAQEALRVRTVDLVSGRRDLSIYGGLESRAERVLAADERAGEAERALHLANARATAWATFAAQFAVALTLLLAVWQVAVGLLSLPMAVSVLLLVLGLPDVLGAVVAGYGRIGTMSRAANRAVTRAAEGAASAKQDHRSALAPLGDKSGLAALKFDEVTYAYPAAECPVLDGLSLEIGAGEWLALVGPSGCGKSTVSGLASRLMQPLSGEISLFGRRIADLTEIDLRTRVTVIGQRPALFNDTIAANLRIANPDAPDEDLWRALQAAALDTRIDRQAEGLQTVLGEGGLGLSGGEQRRLGLARAYLTKPDLFILDEMTEGLDDETALEVLEEFAAFRADTAVLMIAHKSVELRYADRTLNLATL